MGVRGELITRGLVREASVCAVVTRADGRVEDLGEVAYWHKSRLRRWWRALRRRLRRG